MSRGRFCPAWKDRRSPNQNSALNSFFQKFFCVSCFFFYLSCRKFIDRICFSPFFNTMGPQQLKFSNMAWFYLFVGYYTGISNFTFVPFPRRAIDNAYSAEQQLSFRSFIPIRAFGLSLVTNQILFPLSDTASRITPFVSSATHLLKWHCDATFVSDSWNILNKDVNGCVIFSKTYRA